MQKIPLKRFLPGTAWFFIILILVCLPGKDLPSAGWIGRIANIDKVVHMAIFGVLAILFCWPFHNSPVDTSTRLRYFLAVAFLVSIFGLATEVMQKLFIYGRNFDLLDWGADSLGAVFAYWFSREKFSTPYVKP